MAQHVQEQGTVANEIGTAVRHTAMYGLGSIVIKAIGFLMLPFYTHYLSPRDYGVLEILDLSMSLFGMVLHMGIAPALLRAYASSKSAVERQNTVSTAFLFVAGTGLTTFALGLMAVKPLSTLLLGPGVSSNYLMLSFMSFIFSYLTAMPRAYLRALEASGMFTLLETGGLFVILLLNIYFIAVIKLGAIGILWSSVIVYGIQAVGLSVWVLRAVGISFNGQILRHMAAFGLPLIFSNLAMFALNFSDRFFLQRLRSLEVVGLYAVGYKLAFMINYMLVQPFYAMWQARMYAIHDHSEHAKIFRHIFVFYSLGLTYAALGIAVFSPEVVRLMADPKFSAGQQVVPVVALAYVFYGVGSYLQLGMFLANKTKAIGAVSSVAALLNLSLNYVLIGKFGMLGAAWATLLGFMAIAAGSYWFSQRVFPLNLGLPRVGMAMLLGAILYGGCAALVSLQSSVMFAVAVKTAALLAFPIVVWNAGVLSESEKGTLLSAKDQATTGLERRLGWVLGR
jgi:O-antigen/teichoic acid export membrane protein